MAAMPWGCFERLRPAQLELIKSKTGTAMVPWGALEWHGPHNPLGLDGLKAHGLLCALAQQVGGVVLPAVYVGTETIKVSHGFGHTLEHDYATVRILATQFLEQLADEGFRVLVLLTGHYSGRQVMAVREAAAAFAEKYPSLSVWCFPEWETFTGQYPLNHAAHGETSMQMHFDASLVDLSLLPQDRVTTLERDGIMGDDPRTSCAADGAAIVSAFLKTAVDHVRVMQLSQGFLTL